MLFVGIEGQLKAFILAALKALVLRYLLGTIGQVFPTQRGRVSVFNQWGTGQQIKFTRGPNVI